MAFDWTFSLIGGTLMGFSLSTFILYNRIDRGLGHMVKNILEERPSENWNCQILFIIGVLLSPIIFSIFLPLNQMQHLTTNPLLLVISGIFVGLGCQLIGGGLLHRLVAGLRIGLRRSLITISLIIFFAGLLRTFISN